MNGIFRNSSKVTGMLGFVSEIRCTIKVFVWVIVFKSLRKRKRKRHILR